MRSLILIAMLTGSILWAGCGKSKESTTSGELVTNQVAPAAMEPWVLRANELTAAVKIGMTEDEVVKVAGDPKIVRTSIGAQAGNAWQYELGEGNWFTVEFNKSNRVAGAGSDSSIKAQ